MQCVFCVLLVLLLLLLALPTVRRDAANGAAAAAAVAATAAAAALTAADENARESACANGVSMSVFVSTERLCYTRIASYGWVYVVCTLVR